jgi:hypothetical protein
LEYFFHFFLFVVNLLQFFSIQHMCFFLEMFGISQQTGGGM